jgi:hypothetical protein
MKKVSALTLALVMVMVFSSVTFAQGALPGGGWWTGEQVQNIGTASATVAVTAYDKNSTATYVASQTVAAGAAYTFTPNDFASMQPGFQGSAVVSSDQPIKAIVNVTNRQAGQLGVAGGKAAGLYQGVDSSQVGQALYFPLVKGNHYGKTTTFYIQNAGAAASTVSASFRMLNGANYTYNAPAPVQPNQMVAFSLLDVAGFNAGQSDAGNGKIGSLTVNGSQALAGVVLEHFTTEPIATVLHAARGFTAGDFDAVAYAPVIKQSWFGRFTGIQVQNVSAGAINIQVSYTGTDGACEGQTYNETRNAVAPGASVNFIQLTGAPNNTPLPGNCIATARIQGIGTNARVLAVVNESFNNNAVPATGQRAVTSAAIPAHVATTKLAVPLFKDDSFNKRTGLQIMNISASTANNVVARFACRTDGGAVFTAISNPQTVAPGSAVLFINPNQAPGMFTAGNPFNQDKANCAVTVTSDRTIVAIANESVTPGSGLDQDNNNYEGFNLAP